MCSTLDCSFRITVSSAIARISEVFNSENAGPSLGKSEDNSTCASVDRNRSLSVKLVTFPPLFPQMHKINKWLHWG